MYNSLKKNSLGPAHQHRLLMHTTQQERIQRQQALEERRKRRKIKRLGGAKIDDDSSSGGGSMTTGISTVQNSPHQPVDTATDPVKSETGTNHRGDARGKASEKENAPLSPENQSSSSLAVDRFVRATMVALLAALPP